MIKINPVWRVLTKSVQDLAQSSYDNLATKAKKNKKTVRLCTKNVKNLTKRSWYSWEDKKNKKDLCSKGYRIHLPQCSAMMSFQRSDGLGMISKKDWGWDQMWHMPGAAMWPVHSENLSGFKLTFTKLCTSSLHGCAMWVCFSSERFHSNNWTNMKDIYKNWCQQWWKDWRPFWVLKWQR